MRATLFRTAPVCLLAASIFFLCAPLGCGGGEIGTREPGSSGPGGGGGPPPPPQNPDGKIDYPDPTDEVCDQLDNDQDGEVDEVCACDPTVVVDQACYLGPPATRGKGQCKDGLQRCVASGEFGRFGPCEGSVLPEQEICGDGIDNDCNGQVDDAPGCACGPGEQQQCYEGPAGTEGVGICAAGKARCLPDGSGFGACEGQALPGEEICDDGLDNDCDGLVDEGCISQQAPQGCTLTSLEHVVGVKDCGANKAVYMIDDGSGPNMICCPLPATDILSKAPPQVRYGQCATDEVITGATAAFTFKCTKINTQRYALAPPTKPCYFGSGASGGQGVGGCPAHPTSFSVLQQNLFGSDGCSAYPYGSLFVRQTSKKCKDMAAAQLVYSGAVAGDPPANTPVVMFK